MDASSISWRTLLASVPKQTTPRALIALVREAFYFPVAEANPNLGRWSRTHQRTGQWSHPTAFLDGRPPRFASIHFSGVAGVSGASLELGDCPGNFIFMGAGVRMSLSFSMVKLSNFRRNSADLGSL